VFGNVVKHGLTGDAGLSRFVGSRQCFEEGG